MNSIIKIETHHFEYKKEAIEKWNELSKGSNNVLTNICKLERDFEFTCAEMSNEYIERMLESRSKPKGKFYVAWKPYLVQF